MTTFTVLVTRDVTESCQLTIEAADQEEADRLALYRARNPDANLTWERDDTPSKPDIYITHSEEAF